MKKTLLAVALLFASTSVFAQVNVANFNGKSDLKAVSADKAPVMLSKKAKKTSVKGQLEGTTLLCDFSNASAYEFGKMEDHTTPGSKGQWQLKADTNSLFTGQTTDPEMSDYSINALFGLETPGNWTRFFETQANMSAYNGFAYVDFLAIWLVDGKQNTNFNAYVKFTEPIFTYGMNGVDICFSQIINRFNQDKYFIDWSHDPDFTTYDSVEYNVRGVDLNANESTIGTLVVNLPSGTPNCEIISTKEEEPTYIRIRVSCPPSAGDNPHGYFYMLDDVSYKEAPAVRLEVKNSTWYNGYIMIPEIINPDELYMQSIVANTGKETLKDITLSNNMVYNEYHEGDNDGDGEADTAWTVAVPTGVSNQSDGTVIVVKDNGQEEVEETLTELDNKAWTRISYTNGTPSDSTLERNAYVVARTTPQTTSKGIGSYSVVSELTYKGEDGTDAEPISVADNSYWTVSSFDTTTGNYRWSRSYGDAYAYGSSAVFSSGRIKDAQGTVRLTERAAYNKAGYKVCLAYTTSKLDKDVFAKGVELVPAPGYSKKGAKIRTSLWEFQGGSDIATYIIPVATEEDEDELIQSSVYTVKEDDINTLDDVDQHSRVRSANLNKLYVPFTKTALLNDSSQYYACYEMAAQGNFGVANDYPYSDLFGVGSQWNLLVNSGLEEDYAWGYPVGASADFVPMIRLIVSENDAPDVSSLAEVPVASSDIAMFPNPVKSSSVLAYTLNNSGNVTLTITDLMGRTVMTRDEGMQQAGVTYKANINVKDMANGTYFCTINVNGVKATTKFVVNK